MAPVIEAAISRITAAALVASSFLDAASQPAGSWPAPSAVPGAS
jgi:hypothetical protein